MTHDIWSTGEVMNSPYMYTGMCGNSTMERVVREGTVATAATYAHMFSSLPSCGRPTRLMVYDLHTLQNRFYLVRLLLHLFLLL
jgi:hypothetical protein